MSTERALLMTVQLDRRFARAGAAWLLEDEAQELKELAVGCGCRVVGELHARRHQPIAGTFLGRGKLEELSERVTESQAQVVIFNQELSSAQQRTIEEIVRVKTIDRTQLILDIFAQRARSQEGKVQVELAQLRYLLPRLTGKGIMLSRLGGGIGTRGPGEQKLEMDRRRIRARMGRLSEELQRLSRRRAATRARRQEAEVPIVALVGYTNAGKTTLLNRLTGAEAPARHQLFTTLDPLARRWALSEGATVILTDTVGFLHQLPHHLIEAFHATLEEARDAHLLLHVLDITHPLASDHAKAVEHVLARLELSQKPLITVLNKCDLLQDAQRAKALAPGYAPACAISAKTGEGIDQLLRLVTAQIEPTLMEPTRLRLPAERSDLLSAIYRLGQVVRRQEADGVVELTARIPPHLRVALSAYTILS